MSEGLVFVLEAQDIVKTFPGVRALNGVNLKIKKGETHALVGENGAGKSTLMLTLGGVHKPDSGRILLNGKPVTFSSPQDAVAQGISVVYQELSLVPALSVAENIFANRQPVGALGLIRRREMLKKAQELLALFDLEDLDPSTPVSRLSLANQQVIEILKAISTNPSVLILDEPTSSLTEHEAKRLFENLARLNQRGISCIYISHHLSEIFKVAHSVSIMRDGNWVCDARVSDIDEEFLISNMVGRTLVDIYGVRPSPDTFGPVRLDVTGLNREREFSDVSFQLRAGEIVGFSGLVGAGRTEVAHAVFGATLPDSGRVLVDGQEIKLRSPRQAIRAGIGYLTEDRKSMGLYLDFNIRENLVSNRLHRFTFGPFMNDKAIDQAADKAIADYRIATKSARKTVRMLSGGNQQKVLLGAWIGIEPKVLIVDEPTRGVDIGARSEIYGFLRQLAGRGTAIMLISSDLTEILGLSDRIVVMKGGRIAGEVPADRATEESVISLATASNINGGKA